jgi:phage host-nuclease inhibitor protein Gam
MTAAPATKGRNKAAEYVPQTREEVAEAIEKFGIAQRELARITADMNDEIAIMKRTWEEKAAPFQEEKARLFNGIQIWCEARREELTKGGKIKTHAFATGEVNWRIGSPRVVVKGVEAVMDALRRFGLGRLIRTKEEINKEAILEDPKVVSDIKGISITQTENFYVRPIETELEETM